VIYCVPTSQRTHPSDSFFRVDELIAAINDFLATATVDSIDHKAVYRDIGMAGKFDAGVPRDAWLAAQPT
jgi:hypothetical protein